MNELGHELFEVYRAFHHLHPKMDVKEMFEGDIMIMRAIMMFQKKETRWVRVSDLLKVLNMPAPGLSRTLRKLEMKGILERMQDKKDRRVTLVRLTDEGEKIINHCAVVISDYFDEVINRFGEEKTRELIRLNRELQQVMKDVSEENS